MRFKQKYDLSKFLLSTPAALTRENRQIFSSSTSAAILRKRGEMSASFSLAAARWKYPLPGGPGSSNSALYRRRTSLTPTERRLLSACPAQWRAFLL